MLVNVDLVLHLTLETETKTWLSVTANIDNNIYETWKKPTKKEIETLNIVYDIYLPKWNYVVHPQQK